MSGGGGGALGGTATGAASGAGIGFIAGGPAGAAAGAAIGGGLGLIGGLGADQQARAAQGMAEAQLRQQREDRDLALKYAEPSEMEMQQLQQAITLNNQEIGRKQKILDSADPALIEAGKQALSLLQGKEASTLAPLRGQRERQRGALQQKLAAQLGPDYENSSAGIQALNSFDTQTSEMMAGVQNQTLAQFMGYVGMGQQVGNLQPNIGAAAGLGAQRGAINERAIAAIRGTPITSVGAGFMGDLIRGQQQTQMANQLMGAAGTAATLGMLYKGGAPGGGVTGTPVAAGSATPYTDANYVMPVLGRR